MLIFLVDCVVVPQNESGREETFDEVSLTIKGRKSVHECLKVQTDRQLWLCVQLWLARRRRRGVDDSDG